MKKSATPVTAINENDSSRRLSTLKLEREKLSVLFSQTVQEFQSKANVLDELNERRIQQQFLIERIDLEDRKTYLEIIMKYYKTFQGLTSGHIHTVSTCTIENEIREKSANMGHQNRKAPESANKRK